MEYIFIYLFINFCLKQALSFKESKNGGQALILVNWLFQDELRFQSMATKLANIVVRKDDSYIALGWCVLVRNLLQYESSISQYSMNGKTPFSLFLLSKCTICLNSARFLFMLSYLCVLVVF